jgi:hypothetical protein
MGVKIKELYFYVNQEFFQLRTGAPSPGAIVAYSAWMQILLPVLYSYPAFSSFDPTPGYPQNIAIHYPRSAQAKRML